MGQHMKPVLRTSGAVLLAHAGVVWLVVQQLASPSLPGASDPVILASVVAEIPVAVAQPVQTTPTRPAQALAQRPANHAAPRSPTAAAALGTTGSAGPTSTVAQAVVLPSSDADYLNNPPPAYPRMSRRLGEQGTVLVRVFINAEGRAEKADIRTTSGYPRLDDAALETVQRWRYVPGKRAGQPEAMWFNVPIRFVLD